MSTRRRQSDRDLLRYRLRVGGRVGSGWTDWFGADSVVPDGDATVVEVRVADQSELYGRLRRVIDLNLQLIAVERVD